MPEFERRNFPIIDLEVRAENDKHLIRGYAAVFEKLSVPLGGFKEKIRKGAFAESLSKNNVKALWNHNSDFPLGSTNGGTLKLEEDEKGLLFELELPDNSWGRDAKIAIERKDVDGVSFGFTVKKDSWNNENPDEAIRTLEDVELIEVSPTPFPAYPATNVSARSVEEAVKDVNFKDILREAVTEVLKEDRDNNNKNGNKPGYNMNSMLRRLEIEEKAGGHE